VILAATDGVGTKLKLAIESGILDTVGIDLVEEAKAVVEGIAEGCRRSECALIGGETAEMPGMYSEDDFDLAGFSVGIAEKSEMNRLEHVKEGDILIALPSSGVHSNGFSLVRKLLFEKLGMKFDDKFEGKPIIETLLTPTRIYVKTFKSLKEKINALAHITGGGLVENLPRVLPENMHAVIDSSKIESLPIFDLIGEHVAKEEMFRTFNMGVGMVLVVSPENVTYVLENSDGYVIGELKLGEKGVTLF